MSRGAEKDRMVRATCLPRLVFLAPSVHTPFAYFDGVFSLAARFASLRDSQAAEMKARGVPLRENAFTHESYGRVSEDGISSTNVERKVVLLERGLTVFPLFPVTPKGG